ncbi:FAD/NAD(P)-binding oxidoreductase [Thioclava sp. SK-1]|nr:FAD/NAD(P)-binding oxidoreductase [Thioclava sp. SK-1]
MATQAYPDTALAPCDVAIVGAGVVGCAMARRFALEGASVVVMERGADILSGASKANSAILHTGFDAPPNSDELACMQAAYDEYMQIHQRVNLPVLETGAMVIAWSEEEEDRLPQLLAQAQQNNVSDACLLTRSQVLDREPGLAPHARAALFVPREYVIDPWSAPLAYATQAQSLGARFVFNAALSAAQWDGDIWHLRSVAGDIQAKTVINCAGLYGDTVEELLLGQSSFQIRPRKGQFIVYDKAAANHLHTIVLPVPNERTKGVVLTRTIFGNLLVGPTAEEQDDRDRPDTTTPELEGLIAKAEELLPALQGMPVTAAYAGLRPASESKAYRLHSDRARGYYCAGGIRSTGLTGALGIAQHVFNLWHAGHQVSGTAPNDLCWPVMSNLAEHRPRDYQKGGHDGVVCHCEMVTRREIEAALNSPLPPGDYGGLRRRTRCAMGRCQGFNCMAHLAKLSQGRLRDDIIPQGGE